ncbi:hypothetical protein BDF14DRAFT_1761505 [Spinellus fusiger]|nr:hypothetical protein BDF14DRAFT_1761505 [Spinellus fusiger]
MLIETYQTLTLDVLLFWYYLFRHEPDLCRCRQIHKETHTHKYVRIHIHTYTHMYIGYDCVKHCCASQVLYRMLKQIAPISDDLMCNRKRSVPTHITSSAYA